MIASELDRVEPLDDLVQDSEKSDENFVHVYLDEVGEIEILSKEEQISLAKQIEETGDKEARNRLLYSCLPLVVDIAKDYNWGNVEFIDLIAQGNLGLVMALDTYDYRKDVKFSTYATHGIKQTILGNIGNRTRTITTHQPGFLRLNCIVEGKKRGFGLFVENRRVKSPVKILEEAELAERVSFVLDSLKDRVDKDILERFFGLNGYRGNKQSVKQIAKVYGFSDQAIKHRRQKGLESLRYASRARYLASFK